MIEEYPEMEELYRRILGIQSEARNLGGEYFSKYAKTHLKEIELMAGLMLVQLEYAKLALGKEPDRFE